MTAGAPPAAVDRRVATVLFADLQGATTLTKQAGIERAYAIVTGCLRVLDGIARRHGGVVDRYLSDCLMAVFGFPLQTENAPAAAVTAAVEMLEAAARYEKKVASPLPLRLRIGINTGPMIAGDLRGAVVREFAVMGDAVNVAARLKDIGEPSVIHVGGETHAAAAGLFEFEVLPPLVLRGKEKRVAAFRVVPAIRGRRARIGDNAGLVDTRLVGRDQVLQVFRDLMTEVRAGAHRVMVLTGNEGMGKSRLVTEFGHESGDPSCAVVAGRATLARADAPLHLAVDLLADLVGVGAEDEHSTVRAKVDDAANDFRGLDPAVLAGIFAGGSSLGREDVIEQALAEGLHSRGTRGPLIVVCEDVQWADRSSLDLIARLAAINSPALWILTLRPDGDRVARLREVLPAGTSVIALPPLSGDAAMELVDLVVGEHPLIPAARDRIRERAGGNPSRLILGGLLAGAVETELAREADAVERGHDAERRRVTVLFADITGFTQMSEKLPSAEAYRAVSGCLQVLHEVALKHGGTVDKYLGDCILAMFGVPVALEDAPRAALNAAIEMRRRVREFNESMSLPSVLDIHVGINTGLGVAGDISGPLLREFTLMGDAVSVASQLKDIAPPGHIWVGDETHRMTGGDFTFEPIPLAANERVATGNAWDLRSDRERVYRARLAGGATLFAEQVGRDAELAMLRRALVDLTTGRGGVAGVIGDAGLGKSRLLAELAASPEALAIRWAEGRSVAMGRTLRFHPFIDLLRSVLGVADEMTATTYDEMANVVALLLGSETEDLLPYLAMMLGAPLPAAVAERVAGVPVDVIDRMHLRAIRTLLVAAARERPLVVFFEDLYWADRASIELLTELIRVASEVPILFLYAARPGFPETTGRIADVASTSLAADTVLRIELRPLDTAATSKLLATLFPHGTLPRLSRERIAERAAGNPLYLEELLRSLIEQGAIEVTGSGLRATEAIATMIVPATMQEAILARIDHLRSRPKQVLQLAAVVGQRVAEPVLADLMAEPGHLAEALDQLVEAQLLVAERRGDVRHVTFKHRLIQDVTYESILEMRRAELHCDVARVIERRLQGAPGFHGMLAYHYSMGNDLVRAEEELFLAGDDAARAGAPVEALELLEESSRLYLARHGDGGDPAKRVTLHKRLAGAYLHHGQMEESTRNFDQALSLLGEVSPTGRAAIGLAIVKTFGLVGLDLYFRDGGSARRPPATSQDLEIIELMFDRARAQTTADPTRFLLHGFATLRKLRRIDPATVPKAGMMYAGTVGLFSYGGISFDVSRRFLQIADRFADSSDPVESFFCRVMTFCHHFLSGNWNDEYEIPLQDVEEAVRRGQFWDVANHVGLEAIKHVGQGRWRDADAQITWLERMAQTYAYDLASVYVHAGLAYFHTERRALDTAVAACDAMLDAHDEALVRLVGFGTKAKAHVLRGDLPAARATLALASTPLAEGRTPPWHFGVVARSRLMLAVAEEELAGSHGIGVLMRSRRARRGALWAAERLAWFRPEVWQAVGQIYWLGGRRRTALRWFGKALDEAERMGLRPDAARVRLEIGRRLLEAGGSAATFRSRDPKVLLAEARKSFERLGLGWDLARLDLVLSRVGGRSLAAPVR